MLNITCVDRFTRWPEAIPLPDIQAETVARAFFTGWIARFGTPLRITTDQGRQFEASLFRALTKVMGIERIRTTAYHPESNGMVERWHRTLKSAIKCHASNRWTEILPIVLLGLRVALRKDFNSSSAEMTYGTTLRLPGAFYLPPTHIDPHTYVGKLCRDMENIRPPAATRHISTKQIFVSPALPNCTHVYVRHDAVKTPLQPPYDGPYKVISRATNFYRLLVKGKESVVALNRLKPAFGIKEDN